MMKGRHMARKKGFLALGRKSHHEELARIAQPHHEQFDLNQFALQSDCCFAPVHLPIHPRLKRQGQKYLRPLQFPSPFADVASQIRCAATIAFCLQQLIHLTSCVALFARHLLACQQQLVNPLSIRPQHRCRLWRLQCVPSCLRRLNRSAHRPVAVAQLIGDLAHALAIHIVCTSYSFSSFHAYHASLRFGLRFRFSPSYLSGFLLA